MSDKKPGAPEKRGYAFDGYPAKGGPTKVVKPPSATSGVKPPPQPPPKSR